MNVDDLEQVFKALTKSTYVLSEQVLNVHKDLRNTLAELLLSSTTFEEVRSLEAQLWSVAFYRIIEGARSCLKKDKSILPKFLAFLSNSRDFYVEKLLLKLESDLGHSLDSFIPSSLPLTISLTKILFLCHRFFVILGDLERYRTQVADDVSNFSISQSLYNQAIVVNPFVGYGYNQLAVIFYAHGNLLASCYYYIRSFTCNEPFEKGLRNLKFVLETVKKSVNKKGIDVNDSSRAVQSFFTLFLLQLCVEFEELDRNTSGQSLDELFLIFNSNKIAEVVSEDIAQQVFGILLYLIVEVNPKKNFVLTRFITFMFENLLISVNFPSILTLICNILLLNSHFFSNYKVQIIADLLRNILKSLSLPIGNSSEFLFSAIPFLPEQLNFRGFNIIPSLATNVDFSTPSDDHEVDRKRIWSDCLDLLSNYCFKLSPGISERSGSVSDAEYISRSSSVVFDIDNDDLFHF
ncbi:hypothetical protein RCL1_002692 [Eukaryota sp. TZLM3-RCL]